MMTKIFFSRWLVINYILLSLLSIKFKLYTADDSVPNKFTDIYLRIYMTIGER